MGYYPDIRIGIKKVYQVGHSKSPAILTGKSQVDTIGIEAYGNAYL